MPRKNKQEVFATTMLFFYCSALSFAHLLPMIFILSRYRDELSSHILGVVNSPFQPFSDSQVFIAWYYAALGIFFLCCGVIQIWRPKPWCLIMTVALITHLVLDLIRISLSVFNVFGLFSVGEIYWASGLFAVVMLYIALARFRISASSNASPTTARTG